MPPDRSAHRDGARDGKVAVRLSPDRMEAEMQITPPRQGGSPVTLPDALRALANSGVKFGVDHAAVKRLVERAAGMRGQQRPIAGVVARGRPPTAGQDARIAYHELLMTPVGYPQLKADGSVDHFQLNLVRNVAPGTVLATKEPPTKGTPGTNVLGGALPGPDGRDVPLRTGKGCRLSEDGLSIVAQVEGHAVLGWDGRITVSPIFEIRGDVDTSTGNIDFLGTVVILGSVRQGFSVKAGQNVEVHGGIDGGTVEAGGDVIVRYGIQGGHRGRVVAGGRVQCRFVENADLRCRGDLVVSDSILHSRVRCGGKVVVTGRRGSIIGGQIKAREEVCSRVLGSGLLTTTEIEVGVAPDLRDEYEQVRRKLTEVEDGLKKAQQAASLLREMEAKNPAGFTPARRATLMKALRSQYHLQGQRDQLATRKAELEAELHSALSGRVRALDTAYPGVRVVIGHHTYVVMDGLQNVCFYLSPQQGVTIGPA